MLDSLLLQAPADPGPIVHMAELFDTGGLSGERRHVRDGWRKPFGDRIGFHHEYDAAIAAGGWEFHRLQPGLCLAISDLTPVRRIPLRHRLSNQLIVSAMVEGRILFSGRDDGVEDVAGGHCAVFGVSGDAEVRTVYRPDDTLKWVDVYIDRHLFASVTGMAPDELLAPVRDFLLDGGSLACRRVQMPPAVSLAVSQLLACPYRGSFRRAFLVSKTLEIASGVLFALGRKPAHGVRGADLLSAREQTQLALALQLIREHPEQPLNVPALALACGLSRQKLQSGFRVLHGDTVARVRDRLRMEHAMRRIRETSVPVLDIAVEAGYQQATSFARAFRAMYGVSPMRMRVAARNEQLLACVQHKTDTRDATGA